jgi:hypothetical protein
MRIDLLQLQRRMHEWKCLAKIVCERVHYVPSRVRSDLAHVIVALRRDLDSTR